MITDWNVFRIPFLNMTGIYWVSPSPKYWLMPGVSPIASDVIDMLLEYRHIDSHRQTERQTHRQTERQTDRQKGMQADRQIHRH